MKSQLGLKKVLPAAALSATALVLSACQPEVGVGGDPETAVQANATPADSPQDASPDGEHVEFAHDVEDMDAVADTISVRSGESLFIGTQADFAGDDATEVSIDAACGDLSATADKFVLACGDKVLFFNPDSPDSPEELAVNEEEPVTVATQLSDGAVFVGSANSPIVGIYRDGERDEEIEVEEGSDQMLAAPNDDVEDGVVRILRADSTIQNVDWTENRAGGRLRVGQGVGEIAVGDNGVVVAADTAGERIAIYTSRDVVRLHQYGNTEGIPWAVAWDNSRNLAWAATTDNNQAEAFEISSGAPKSVGTINTVADAQSMAVLDDGTVVTASATGDGLQFVSDPDLDSADDAATDSESGE